MKKDVGGVAFTEGIGPGVRQEDEASPCPFFSDSDLERALALESDSGGSGCHLYS
jgi:hypothetical protein